MKNLLIRLLRKGLLIIIIFLSFSVFAQTAPPPPPGGSSGAGDGTGGDDTSRTGAPIGGGLFILLGLGAAYGGKKLYDLRKEKLEE